MFSATDIHLAEALLAGCRARRWRLATAESCTGGLVAACLTAIPGSSDVFDRGWVTYSNIAKEQALGVPAAVLAREGAVCEAVARAMAEQALLGSTAKIACGVTGIAGPGGGSADKPVGLVHLAAAGAGRPTLHERHVFGGERDSVRAQTLTAALTLMMRLLDDAGSDGAKPPAGT